MNRINGQTKWNRKHGYMDQTGRCPRAGSWGDWVKQVTGLAKEHICIPHGMDNSLVKVKEGVGGGGWRWVKGRKKGTPAKGQH